MTINHIYGDILRADTHLLLHQVNCQGVMGSGLAKQIKEKYPEVYNSYKLFCNTNSSKQLLGKTLPVLTVPNPEQKALAVVNLFAQEFYGRDGKCYTDYDALETSLTEIKRYTAYKKIAIPYKMGCGLGGGDWDKVYNIIKKVFKDTDFKITIYQYNK